MSALAASLALPAFPVHPTMMSGGMKSASDAASKVVDSSERGRKLENEVECEVECHSITGRFLLPSVLLGSVAESLKLLSTPGVWVSKVCCAAAG